MDKNEFISELNKRIETYLNKSKMFNSKKTILILKREERNLISELSKNNNIHFDKIFEIEKDEEVIDILKKERNKVNYFLSNKVISDELYKNIFNLEVNLDNIYVGPTKNSYFDLYDKRENIYNNAEKISKVFNYLEDEKSKEVYWNVLIRLCLQYQFHYFYEVEDFIQYFPNEFKFKNEEVYLDAGVYNGKNIYEFIEKVNNNYKYIYGIEADPNNYEKSKENLKNISNLKIYQKALHSHEELLSFLSTNSSTKKGNAHVQPFGDLSVKGIKGDNLKYTPTFIKMDIEGSEKDALKGLKNTIISKNPKLAICIYHFQKDFWEIPLIIKSFNSNYKIMIRNHEKMFCLTETVCYAYLD